MCLSTFVVNDKTQYIFKVKYSLVISNELNSRLSDGVVCRKDLFLKNVSLYGYFRVWSVS